jgi:geranylgeranyl pyrophosphate synthase
MSDTPQTQTLADLLSPSAARVAKDLDQWLIAPGVPDELARAMRYATAGGKRIRAALVLMGCQALGGAESCEAARRAAAAVECIHAYSLVHDDLPAMDDDTLRRGQPTVHVKFGEAMAILTGDALLTRAVHLLCPLEGPLAARLICVLTRSAGPRGMIAGQVADMDLCDVPDGLEGVEYIHRRKTGALIEASAKMGGHCAQAGSEGVDRLAAYGRELGVAFQVVDDLLDVIGQAQQLGKTPGKDAQSGKRTTVAQIGVQAARDRVDQHTAAAIEAIKPLGPQAEKLRRLAQLLQQRTR